MQKIDDLCRFFLDTRRALFAGRNRISPFATQRTKDLLAVPCGQPLDGNQHFRKGSAKQESVSHLEN